MKTLAILFAISATLPLLQATRGRDGKVLSLFNIVRFKNGPCEGGSNKNGTCYTAEECETKGGTNSGTCAAGYGVCCTFTARCGATSSENCTYFESSGSEVGQCGLKICRCDPNVCQLRLDFSTFAITGPSTVTVSAVTIASGQILTGKKEAAPATQCVTDTFSITNPNGLTPPSICGTNTGEHMYVDSSEMCNDLVFQLGTSGRGANIISRSWNIKVTQYSCDYNNLAPVGCTQYFFGDKSTSGVVKTFNYDGGIHLADQNQNICVRRERGICKICWSPTAKGDFSVSGMTIATMTSMEVGVNNPFSCCGYGSDGSMTKGYDCVTIPGAVKNTNDMKALNERFCGRKLISVTGATTAMASGTICSSRTPFNLRFISDHWEFTGDKLEANNPGKGARLGYELINCGN